jgi:hypothetical protein
MGKKSKEEKTFGNVEFELGEQEATTLVKIEEHKNVIQLTHHALSIVKSGNKYSVVRIGFNPKQNYVSPVIETIESNTDLFIMQERLSVLLYDIHNNVMGEYE